LNGKFLGCVFDQVPVGMDCFPTGINKINQKSKQNEILSNIIVLVSN
jgi:hypothetical protein